MKKIFKVFICIFIASILFGANGLTVSARISAWPYPGDYQARKDDLVYKAEARQYLLELYSFFTGDSVDEDEEAEDTNEVVTRGELALSLLNTVKKANPSAYTGGCDSIHFPDKVKPEQLEALRFVYSRGISFGRNYEVIGADDPLSLAEMLEMLERTRVAYPEFAVIRKTFDVKKAYLTFDDAVSKNTYSILDILDKYDVKATFFLNGQAGSELLCRMRDSGHAIGNHTYSHNYSKIYKSSNAFWEDFNKEQNYLVKCLGYSPVLMRFPGGSNNTISRNYGGSGLMKTLVKQVKAKGYYNVDWNVDSGDALGKNVPASKIISNVLSGAKGKDNVVILMHHINGKGTTVKALPSIIEGLQKMGFVIIAMTEDSFMPQFIK